MDFKAIMSNGDNCKNPTIFSIFLSGALEKMDSWCIFLYFFIITLGTVCNILSLWIVAKSRVFHANLQFPIWWTAFAWFEIATSKILIILYQVMYLEADNGVKDFPPENSSGIMLLAWSASMHYHFIFSVLAAPFIVIIERGFATWFIYDYEKKRRGWILVLILLVQNSFSGGLTILTLLNITSYIEVAIFGFSTSAASLTLFLWLRNLNVKKLARLKVELKLGQLSAKYQLRENLKTFRMIVKIFALVLILMMILIVLKTLPVVFFAVDDQRKLWFRNITDMIVHAGPIYVTICIIFAVDDYHHIFRQIFGWKTAKISPVPIFGGPKIESDLYFELLKKAMNK
ncbi:unnamed protein product [Caenorhabditis angaria]|uniref:G-protein coupled receptors family 1 profile domain-containing protein n=1 Tax=Caenorhabditis angaria TaxID=860376 RepID=A0A9P1IRD3_9PELO|nr:unnamed protein product [Caenorhabditis angaria]